MVLSAVCRRGAGGLRVALVACLVVFGCCAMGAVFAAGSAGAVEFGSEGSAAGQFREFGGLAVAGNGYVFELERAGNRRVNVFTATGKFVRAFGWGVADGAEKLEVCTSSCQVGLAGEGAGEIVDGASGIAVSPTSGHVFVANQSNVRVDEFTEEGGFIVAFGREVNLTKAAVRQKEELNSEPVTVTPREENTCNGSATGTGPATGECQRGVSSSEEAAFEFTGSTPVSVGVGSAGPMVYVGGRGRVEMFDEDGEYVSSAPVETASKEALEVEAVAASTSPSLLAPDVYVVAKGVEDVVEYEEASAGSLSIVHELVGAEPEALAYDATSSTLMVEHEGQSADRRIFGYNALGEHTQVFSTHTERTAGTHSIVWDAAAGELYLTTGIPRKIRSVPVPPVGPFVSSNVVEVGPEGSVRMAATVDPEGAETTVSFEYESAPGVYTVLANQTVGEVGDFGEETNDVSGAPLEANTHLAPGTTYHYRVRAVNGSGVTGVGFTQPLGSFTTLPAAQITGLSASSVTATGATIAAAVNPLDEPSSWWVEYAPASGGAYKRSTVGYLPGVNEDQQVTANINGLSADTAYRVRLVVENVLAKEPVALRSEEITVITQAVTVGSGLPDGRQWEMVSPSQKQNASFEGITGAGGLTVAAVDGNAVSYLATAADEAGVEGEPSPGYAQILSKHREGGGWSTRDIASKHEEAWVADLGHQGEFLAFSNDLSTELMEPTGDTLLGGATERTPYLRVQALCETGSSGCYEPLVNTGDVTSGQAWGGNSTSPVGEVKYEAATPDLSHVVLGSAVPLLAGASGPGLYEWSAGHLTLLSAAKGSCPATVSEKSNRDAISEDGDRVIWQNRCEGEHLYMYEAGRGESVQLDVGSASGDGAVFQEASKNGSRVFFSDVEPLTEYSRAHAGAPDLYVYEANADTDSTPGVVRDVTVPVNEGESANVMGLIPGVSEDGSIAYVIAGGVLSSQPNEYGDVAQSGQPNLYRIVRSESGGGVVWSASYITTLSPDDQNDWGGGFKATTELTSYLSGDGRWLAFMSDRSLTGYDNRDAVSGEPDEEVFLYDGSTGRLVCASCNPTGARPHGQLRQASIQDVPLIDRQNNWVGRWLAGEVSGWDSSILLVGGYAPRYVSDSGRLFFNSSDALVSGDANGTWDVYEYEPPEVGSCSISAASYSAAQSGCIGLISGGSSSEESVFLDASVNGNDVFFLTAAKLVPQDDDEAYDVYDAHVCGSGWECTPPASSGAGGVCESAGSCKAPSGSGNEGVSGTPASMTFEGSGNLAKSSTGKSKSTGVSKAQKLRRALARCRRVDSRGRKRKGCEAVARHRFGHASGAHKRTARGGRASRVGVR